MNRFSLKGPAGRVLFLTWLLFGLYYASRFNYSAVLPLIRADLALTNTGAGWLIAFFFVAYTAFQLPAGYLGDRFGPRKILTAGALISIAGNLIISQGAHFYVLAAGQAINGLGQAVGWSCALKLVVNWFPRARRATAIGFFATCVAVGSSFGIRFSGYLGDHFGWPSAFLVPPVLLAAVTVVFWVFVRNSPSEKGLADFDDETQMESISANTDASAIRLVLTHPTLRVVAMVYFCFVYVQFGCLVWIPTFLTEIYALSIDRASTIAAVVLIPGIFASPVAGFLSDHYFNGRRKPLLFTGLATLALTTFLLGMGIRLAPAIALLIVIGFMIVMPDILLATYPSDILSRKLSATGMGFLTTFTSLAGILTNVASGRIADRFQSFNAVFFSFAIMALIAAVLCLRIREKEIHPIERRARI
ncbi:MAG: MFS transporter [Deltaproteobacteria bacterium]|jgi:sugar phosphate permease|nr:MFS transporter [Deltaproteobacteria bacterium]